MHVPDRPGGGDSATLPDRRQERVVAWRPQVPGVAEVLHARFVEHVYPPHTHDTWTLLVVEDGVIRFDLHRSEHGAVPTRVTLLPPHVAHTGRAATDTGFHKQVLYLDSTVLDEDLIGAALDDPSPVDPLLRERVGRLHRALTAPGEELEAESRLVLIRARLHAHLQRTRTARTPPRARNGIAQQLRELLDSRVATGTTLREAGQVLHAHPDALVRAFTTAFGLPPHRYLVGRRVDVARRLLLAGHPVAEAATAAGFHDQAHLHRHFTRQIGVSPGRYVHSR